MACQSRVGVDLACAVGGSDLLASGSAVLVGRLLDGRPSKISGSGHGPRVALRKLA